MHATVTANDVEVFASHAFRNLPISALSLDDMEDIRVAMQMGFDAIGRRAAAGIKPHG